MIERLRKLGQIYYLFKGMAHGYILKKKGGTNALFSLKILWDF